MFFFDCRFWKAELTELKKSLMPGCPHNAEVGIEESGDGTVVEWECIQCKRIRIEDKK